MMTDPHSPDAGAQLVPLLEDEALEELDAFLESDRVDPEALELYAAHGFLVALAITPAPIDPGTWVPVLFNGEPAFADDAERDHQLGLLERLRANAIDAFEHGHLPELPFDLEVDGEPLDTPVGAWCAGFMETVFLDESAWFGPLEERAAQLLLPFMALSGLFEDEDPELSALANSPREATRLARQLPELCLDLYLLYRAPPEPVDRAPKQGGKQSRGRRGGNR